MSLQNAAPALIAFARCFTRPFCPQCGHEQLVPERSEFVGDGGVRHAWLCEACSHDFCTTVAFGRLAA